MPTAPLPENPSLEHLKNQAKLVRDLIRSGDDGARGPYGRPHREAGEASKRSLVHRTPSQGADRGLDGSNQPDIGPPDTRRERPARAGIAGWT